MSIVQDLITLGVNTKVIATITKTNRLFRLDGNRRVTYKATPLYFVLSNLRSTQANKQISHLSCCYASFMITDLIMAVSCLDTYSVEPTANLGVFVESFLHRLVYLSFLQDDFHPILDFVSKHKPNVNAINYLGQTPLMDIIEIIIWNGCALQINLANLQETIRLLLQAGNHDYITPVSRSLHGMKCLDMVQQAFEQAKHQYPGDDEHNQFQHILQSIYTDMASSCLQKFLALPYWEYRDMASTLKNTWGPEEEFHNSNTNKGRLTSPICDDKDEYFDVFYPAALQRFNDNVVKSPEKIVHKSYLCGFKLTQFGLPLDLTNIIMQYESPYQNLSIFFQKGIEYYYHVRYINVGYSVAANVPTVTTTTTNAPVVSEEESLAELVPSTEIIPRNFATVIREIEELATLHPLIPTPKSDEMSKLDDELLKEYPLDARLFRDTSKTEATGTKTNQKDVKEQLDNPPYNPAVCYQYRYAIRRPGGKGIEKNFITVSPSLSSPETHTVIRHDIAGSGSDHIRRPNPQAFLLVCQFKKHPAPQNKLHLKICDRTRTGDSLEMNADFAMSKLFKNYS